MNTIINYNPSAREKQVFSLIRRKASIKNTFTFVKVFFIIFFVFLYFELVDLTANLVDGIFYVACNCGKF